MNEQLIQKLVDEAGLKDILADHVKKYPGLYQEPIEVFARLIVRDCINRIEQNRSSGENTDSWTITRDMAFHQMKEDLKKHFGVEE